MNIFQLKTKLSSSPSAVLSLALRAILCKDVCGDKVKECFAEPPRVLQLCKAVPVALGLLVGKEGAG